MCEESLGPDSYGVESTAEQKYGTPNGSTLAVEHPTLRSSMLSIFCRQVILGRHFPEAVLMVVLGIC